MKKIYLARTDKNYSDTYCLGTTKKDWNGFNFGSSHIIYLCAEEVHKYTTLSGCRELEPGEIVRLTSINFCFSR